MHFQPVSQCSLSLRFPLFRHPHSLKAMATLVAAATCQTASLTRITSPKTSTHVANLVHRRGLAGATDHHGPPRVNFWQDPMSPSKWKEEHFVIVSLSGWGLLIFGGYKFFTRGKGKKEEGKSVGWPTTLLASYDQSLRRMFPR